MQTRTQIPECLVSTEDNDARKRKPTKDGKNEGDDTSPQQAKRHQRAMGTVQEQAIETILLLRHVHWVRPYESAMWNTSPYRSALASGHQTALHGWVQHDRWAQSNPGRTGPVVIWMWVMLPSGMGTVTSSCQV